MKSLKKNKLFQKILVIYRYKIDLFLQKILFLFVGNKPLKDIIIIESHNDFDSNGGAFYEYLISQKLNKKYKIVWLLKNDLETTLPDNVVAFKLFKPSIRKAYYICRAKVFTADSDVIKKMRKDQQSYYFTHGSICLKNVAGKVFVSDIVDYILSPSQFYAPIQAKQHSTNYPNQQFLYLGYPSHDKLLSPSTNEISKITKKKYSKYILWMPTFRSSARSNRQDSTQEYPFGVPIIYDNKTLEELNGFLVKSNMLLIVKMHPMQDSKTIKIFEVSNIKVLTGETVRALSIDNFELMKDVDALISDYSSVAYDFLMLNKPIGYDFSDLKSYKLGLSVTNVEDYIAGEKILDYPDMLNFLSNVSTGIDSYYSIRIELKNKLFTHSDNKSCQRISEFMGL